MGRRKKVRSEESDTNGQGEMPLTYSNGSTNYKAERTFEVELSLSLKEEGSKANKIILSCTKARGTVVQQILEHAICEDRRNQAIIQATLDNPSQRELELAEAEREANQEAAGDALDA